MMASLVVGEKTKGIFFHSLWVYRKPEGDALNAFWLLKIGVTLWKICKCTQLKVLFLKFKINLEDSLIDCSAYHDWMPKEALWGPKKSWPCSNYSDNLKLCLHYYYWTSNECVFDSFPQPSGFISSFCSR